jgi:hypothetical protein
MEPAAKAPELLPAGYNAKTCLMRRISRKLLQAGRKQISSEGDCAGRPGPMNE